MKKFKLKVPKYTFDHKGMIIRGKLRDCEHMVDVYARDICDDNMDIMSKANIRQCYEEEPRIMENEPTWWAGGEYSYLSAFTKQLFQFVTWESQKYYVIEDVLENCEIVEG